MRDSFTSAGSFASVACTSAASGCALAAARQAASPPKR